MTEETTYVQMNVNVTTEDARMVDHMAADEAIENRSAFIRRLIRQEWARRYSKPNPAVTVKEAVKAGKAVTVK